MKHYSVEFPPEPEFWRTHDWIVYDEVAPLEAQIKELEQFKKERSEFDKERILILRAQVSKIKRLEAENTLLKEECHALKMLATAYRIGNPRLAEEALSILEILETKKK